MPVARQPAIATQRMPKTLLAVSLAACAVLSLHGVSAIASTTGKLGTSYCAHPDTIHVDGFEAQSPRYVEPTNGSGGTVGGGLRDVYVPGLGTRNYYRYVPSSYVPTRPTALLMVLHGTGGPSYPANTAAYTLIFGSGNPTGTVPGWKAVADAAQIIIVAPIGNGANGGWIVPPSGSATDYDMFNAILADMKSAYNIDGSRIHGWGFSSGGSVMNDLIFGPYTSPGIDINTFAGLGNWAGGLDGLACSNEPDCVQLIAAAPRKLPIDLHVGYFDDVSRPHVIADYIRFQNAGWIPESNLWYRETVNGHEYNPAAFPEIWDHLCPFQRLP